jgi:hypothetical protein
MPVPNPSMICLGTTFIEPMLLSSKNIDVVDDDDDPSAKLLAPK